MTFYEYIQERIEKEEEFEAIIGGAEMTATFSFGNWKFTDYCMEKYGELLESEIEELEEFYGTKNVEVMCDDEFLGYEFCKAVAGYVSEEEWSKLFTYRLHSV